MEKSSYRIPSLDGLRTISILLVIAGHWLHVLGYPSDGNLGNLGVRVFFVISGFLITGLLIKELEKTDRIDLPKFYFRRTLRIFPPYYFYLLVVGAMALAGAILIPPKSFLAASFYVSDYVNPSAWLLGHTWSLAVEEQFYLIFPTVLLVFGLRKTKLLLGLLIVVCPLLRLADFQIFGDSAIWVMKGFHANMDALAAGCLLALFYKRLHGNPLYRRMLGSKLVFLLIPAILLANAQVDHPRIFLGLSFTVINLSTAVLIDWAVTNHETMAGRFLNSAPMVTLGMMSYSIYLWQQPFFNPQNPGALTRTPLNFIGLAAMTVFSYYFVEKYSLRLRQRLEKRFFSKRERRPAEIELPAAETA
ncbi:MAG: acyltransferase [Acidobacteria bacterium]|nr:acyltransferase [Acidobacteriota bacterium]